MRTASKVSLVLISAVGLVLIMAGYNYFSAKSSHEGDRILVSKLDKYADSFQGDLADLNRFWSHVHKAYAYSEEGDYDASDKEYENAITHSRSSGDVWMVRDLRRKLYEKMGNYGMALKEVEWLMQNNKRPDVLEDLRLDKSRLLAAKASAEA